MTAYYNEFDPYAAQWLRNLIDAGHIAPGDVDERSICEVQPSDLIGYTQCHFFAGIGIWSHVLRLAGWPDDREVWTGSCPCQPFSVAGRGRGTDDARHLWPEFFRLIAVCRPDVVFGEQVASKDGLAWLDLVQADLEGADYAVGALDTCAASVGAPHIRQRLYWVADTDRPRHEGDGLQPLLGIGRWSGQIAGATGLLAVRGLGDPELPRLEGHAGNGDGAQGWPLEDRPGSEAGAHGGLADSVPAGRPERGTVAGDGQTAGSCEPDDERPRPTDGFWRAADWLYCRDGKWRPVEPGTFPLAHGIAGRVGRLRAFGNGLCTAQAEAIVGAYLGIEEVRP